MSAPSPTGGSAPSPTGDQSGSADWRKSVPQSYRSEEVRGVAKVLASLEPGATSASKLMLAMRFEDSIFQSASSLADYRKRLTKRLKKVQKSYKPPKSAAAATSSSAGGGAASSASGAAAEEEARRTKEAEVERDLREQYGDELRFVVRHADEAVEAMREKHGKARADHLRQHTDNAEQWAVEIGLDLKSPKRKRRVPREVGYLDRLRVHLEQRVDNIRSHVVKLTRPDLFLEETLIKLEDEMADERIAEELATASLRILDKLGQAKPETTDAAGMKKLLERVSAAVAPPRRGSSVADVRLANLARLDKIRSGGQALIAYLALDAHGKAEVKGCLRRVHSVAVEELANLIDALAESGGGDGGDGERAAGEVRLEDAWNRVMEYDDPSSTATDAEPPSITEGGNSDQQQQQQPDRKRARTDSSLSSRGAGGGGGRARPSIVTRSRVLLTPGRKAPTNLIVALRGKRAELIQPSSPLSAAAGTSSRLRIVFGGAFEMIVHFVPLLVAIRALPGTSKVSGSKGGENMQQQQPLWGGGPSDFRRTIVDGGLPTWTPSTHGLDRGRGTGSAPSTAPSPTSTPLTVLDVSGTAATVGPIIAKKLDYASASATRVLRRCFAEVAGRTGAASDFEVEISEATALLRFVQMARSTYTPGWQEDDP